MIGFMLANVLLAILVISKSPFLNLLANPFALVFGILVMSASLFLGYRKKISTLNWHDGFTTGSLLTWYAYWQPQFPPEAPMFFAYPVYYALFTAFLTLNLINKCQYFDLESVKNLRYLDSKLMLGMDAGVIFIFIGLIITRHYALYPMAMTFFLVRHTMKICVENIDRAK
jgi:hypothetical protein